MDAETNCCTSVFPRLQAIMVANVWQFRDNNLPDGFPAAGTSTVLHHSSTSTGCDSVHR